MALPERLRVGDHGPHVFQPGARGPNQNVSDGNDYLGSNLQGRLMNQQVEVASDGPLDRVLDSHHRLGGLATLGGRHRGGEGREGVKQRRIAGPPQGRFLREGAARSKKRGCQAGPQYRMSFTEVTPQA